MSILGPIFGHPADRPAALAGDTEITYGRLCADIDSMAHWLLGKGLAPGDRVTLHITDIGNPGYWDWILHLGAIRAGLVHSTGPMPPGIARTGLIGPYKAAIGAVAKLTRQANPELKLAFGPKGTAPLAEQLAIGTSRQSLDGLEAQAARLLSTSGTTGKPKLLAWDAGLISDRLKQVREIGGIDGDTKLLTLLGLITTTGFRYPIAGWQVGAFVILAGIGDKWTDMAQAAGLSTFLATSPFRMRGFLRNAPGQWPGKAERIIELFGGRVPPGLRDEVLARCCDRVLMSYGATEVGRVACGDAALVDRHSGAVGMVEPGITVEIVDREGKPRPAGEAGIVRMKSAFMCRDYLSQSTVSSPRASLRDGWFYPGDFGIVFEDGLFAITGRLSETLNVAGAKLDPVTMEEKISRLAGVDDVVVMSLQLDSGDALAVGVVCSDGVDLHALKQQIAPLLPKVFPFSLIRMPQIPRNAMGRIARQAVTKAVTTRAKGRQEVRKNKPSA